jgi:hypothetical protein
MIKKIILLCFLIFALPAGIQADWPMAGANPQRTNWVPETLPDVISTQWVKPIYGLVPQRVQAIGATVGSLKLVFVASSQGLYAINADTGADVWQYATALPLGHSPTFNNGFLYVGGMDKKIHKINASNGLGIWTFGADGGFVTSPIVANGKVYATSRDGALYAINDLVTPTLAWKFQTGNQIYQSPAFMAEDDGISSTTQGSLYIASNDGYAYAVNAGTGSQIWRSTAIPDPVSPGNDKFPSQGFYSWWPVIYGNDVILMRTILYQTTGTEGAWLFGASPNTNSLAGTLSSETQSGFWPVGEKVMDLRTNTFGNTLPDYFETQLDGDSRDQHGLFRRNAFFINRMTGVERQFDLDNDNKIDAAPVTMVGDGGTHDIPIVSGFNNVLYFNAPLRGRSASFNTRATFGWKVGTPFVGMSSSSILSSDEPTGISGAGDKIYYNHCCDRLIAGINISRPNTDYPSSTPNREFSYISQSGGGINYFSWPTNGGPGMPLKPDNYYYKEAVKFFWDPQPALNPPCCAAVFWNENDKVGPTVYNGKLFVILGNALVALGAGGSGQNATVLPSTPNLTIPNLNANISDTQLRTKLEQEVSKIVDLPNPHLKPSFMWSGNMTLNNYSAQIEDKFFHYWRNPADLQRVLIRALPFLSTDLRNRVRPYLQSEYNTYPLHSITHIGFGNGTQRDPWPYPPYDTNLSRHLFNPPQSPQLGFDAGNIYTMWKYAEAGLGNASTLVSNIGTSFKSTITANDTNLTDAYLAERPLIANKYIGAYKGFIELKSMAGQPLSPNDPYIAEYNRLLSIRSRDLTTFPTTQLSAACNYRCYYGSMLTYYNFAHMTPDLGNYLHTFARSTTDPNKDILSILQKYQNIAPYWMQVHNGETQGESAIQPYQQMHSLFQALALVKRAPQSELIKYLDTPIIPVGDLYYIDNLVAAIENSGLPTPTIGPTIVVSPTPAHCSPFGNADCDSDADTTDIRVMLNNYLGGDFDSDLNNDGRVNTMDVSVTTSLFAPPPPTPTGDPNATPTPGKGGGGVTVTPIPTLIASSPTPTPLIQPTPTTSGTQASVVSGTGHTEIPSSWTYPAMGTVNESEFVSLMNQSISQARAEYGSGIPKVVMLITSFGHLNEFAPRAQAEFPGALIVGTGTGTNNYNPFTEGKFSEHGNRGLTVLALGGNSITQVRASSQQNVGQGSNEAQMITAGSQLSKDLIPFFSASLKNLVIYFGPGHDPNQKTMLCGFKLGFTTQTDLCNSGSTTPPPELPGHVKILGTGGYYNANTVVGTNVMATSAIAVLIQGNFQLALSGLAGTPTPSNISTPVNQIISSLGGIPEMLFLVPAHPTVGAYEALRSQIINLLPGTTIFGHEGGGEIGHDSTAGSAIGDAFHLFMAGIK